MQARLNIVKAAPEAYEAVAALDRYVVKESGLERGILHLIKIRASQINGCASASTCMSSTRGATASASNGCT